ncbi:hypothetical protein [Streptomyces asiaticus]|uniref:hypothetical protein n=1 Tax=Streptomyces asiaticus TaxID=114695 RepID=UPI003F666C66
MSREVDGWEYVKGRPRWAPTVETQMANMLCGLYGHEYEEKKAELEDLVRAAQRDAAEKLYKEACRDDLTLETGIGVQHAADLITPAYPEEGGE